MIKISELQEELEIILSFLWQNADLKPGNILVIGCSTSEVQGKKIGKSSNKEIAQTLYATIENKLKNTDIYPAFQGCEHINRALTIPRECWQRYDFTEVTVKPVPEAGGAMAATAYQQMERPVVVENVKAQAGIDIGDTFIAMHLEPVVVPLRAPIAKIGQAHVTLAKTRPKLIGGRRAQYP